VPSRAHVTPSQRRRSVPKQLTWSSGMRMARLFYDAVERLAIAGVAVLDAGT
jgi:hypothetical protein